MSKKKAFFGGLTIGYLFRHWREVGIAVAFLYFVGIASWGMLHPLFQWLLALCALAVPALFVWRRQRTPKRTRTRERYQGPVAFAPPGQRNWVYIITEWRGHDDRWLDRDRRDADGVQHIGAVRHLVYIGVTSAFDLRMSQHAGDKHWWHPELMFEVVLCENRAQAESREARWISEAAQKRALTQRPRENWEHNPSYDRKRCEYMHRRRVETSPAALAA